MYANSFVRIYSQFFVQLHLNCTVQEDEELY